MTTNRFRTLFRLSIPVCLLAGLLLAAPGLTVRSAPAGAAPAETAAAAPVAVPIVVSTQVDEFGTGLNCSLREAIQTANTGSDFGGCTGAGGIITLPAGAYTLTGAAGEDGNISGDLDITSDVTINGADEKTTFIQAGTNTSNGVDRVLHIFNGYTVEINDVTIRYGKAPDGVTGAGDATCNGSDGGGIYAHGPIATVILNDCVVAYNRAGDGGTGCPSVSNGHGGNGGGIYAYDALELNDTTVMYNESGDGGMGTLGNPAHHGGYGGGIYLSQGEATLTDSFISLNTTGAGGQGSLVLSGTAGNGSYGGLGGGIYTHSSSTLTLTNTIVVGNGTGDGGDGGDSAGGDGGDGGAGGHGAGIYNNDTLVVVESVIDDNTTGLGGRGGSGTSNGDGGNRGHGGGIYAYNAETSTLSDTTIRDNLARNGGGLYSYSGTTTLDGCTVSGNTAAGSGGGLYSTSTSTTMLTNSTFSSNGAHGSGGGIQIGGTARLTHVTVTDNTADLDNDGSGGGGGLYGFAAFTTMTNTIIAKNYDKGGENPDCIASITSGDYNLLGIGDSVGCTFTSQAHDQEGTAASPIDPLMGNLRDNGGPTWTHAIKSSSPAVDQIPAGVNGCVMGSLDQRGVLRLPPCDIGAYEVDPASVYLPLVVKE